MTKHIRPLTAFKKLNPEIYSDIFDSIPNDLSVKGKENEFYFLYACVYSGIKTKNVILDPAQISIIEGYKNKNNPTEKELEEFTGKVKIASYHLTKYEYNAFFYTNEGEPTNKLTISELGRLLLTGWHYGIKEYTQELLRYVERSYYKKVKENEAFNDLEIHSVVKHLRENIIYYYQNKDECKFYILDKLFNKTLKSILPPLPEKLKKHEELIDLLTEIRKNQIAKGIDFWINKADELENKVYELEAYADYLKEGIVSYGTGDFLTFDDYKKQIDEEDEVLNQQEEVDKNNTNEIQGE